MVERLPELGPVELDHDLLAVAQVAGQASAVAAGALDRPRTQHGVLIGELHQLLVAIGRGLDGDLAEHTTGAGIDRGRGVGVDMGVDADDDIDHLA